MKKLLPAFFLLFSIISNAQQWDGLTLYSTSNSTNGYLIDTASVVTHSWTFTGGTGYSTHMIPGGTLFRSVMNSGNIITGGGVHGRIQKVDYNGNVLWDYVLSNSLEVLHHDHCPLPNGNVLVIVYDVKNPSQISAAGCTNSTLTTLQSEKILELKPIGTNSAQIVWQWNVWDHLVQNVNSSAANYQTSIVNHPELFNVNYMAKKDWLHMNGIDYNPILDQIVISSHNLNEWYVIDHSTTTAEAASHNGGFSGKGGDILYRWGNPAAYQAAGSTILNVTHDAHWIPEGVPNAGNLVGVNNQGSSGPKTTIDGVTPPRSGLNYTINLGSQYTPATYNTRHTSTGYTSNMGSSNQFPNGNQMVCLATAGTIYEIDAAGNTLWTKSTGGVCPQSHRYTQCYIDYAAPAQPSISVSGSDLVSTSATTYQWYVNGDLIVGATNQTLTAPANGMYVVRTTDVNGCVYVYSAGHLVGPPIGTGMKNNSNINSVKIYPNPSNGIVKLNLHPNYSYQITVSDIGGKRLISEKNVDQVDLSAYGNGIYFITISNEVLGSTTKKISILK